MEWFVVFKLLVVVGVGVVWRRMCVVGCFFWIVRVCGGVIGLKLGVVCRRWWGKFGCLG